MRKFKVVYQKNIVVLNQLSISVETVEIEADSVYLEDEWLSFFKTIPYGVVQGQEKMILVLAIQRAMVFLVEEIVEGKN